MTRREVARRFKDVAADEVVVYSEGLLSASACAPAGLTGEEVTAAVNATHPSGTRSGWQLSEDKTFHSGDPMPAACSKDAGRRHWLLEA